MTAPVSPAPVWDLINGFSSYWALATAAELGLFDALADAGDEGLDGAGLAAAVGAREPGPVRLLAETLVALGLLDVAGARWSLTPVAARYLVTSSAASMAALVAYSPGPRSAWPLLADTVRAGAPTEQVVADLAQLYPRLVRATAPTQFAVAVEVAAMLDRNELWPERPTVVDLGCGSGAWLTALLAGRPLARAIGVDRANVLAIAERAVGAAGLAEQFTAIAGDYLEVTLPVEHADVVVLAHVLRAEPAERAQRLLARAVELARPGGVVVVVDYLRPDPDDGSSPDRAAVCGAARHELLLSLTMLASTSGSGVALADLRAWADAARADLTDSFLALPRQPVHLIRPRSVEATS